MTRDDIIRWAREASILGNFDALVGEQWRQDTIRDLERFAALVAAAEREACAKVCDDAGFEWHLHAAGGPVAAYVACAAAIRARGQT